MPPECTQQRRHAGSWTPGGGPPPAGGQGQVVRRVLSLPGPSNVEFPLGFCSKDSNQRTESQEVVEDPGKVFKLSEFDRLNFSWCGF